MHTTANYDGSALDALLKSGPIRCCAVDSKYAHAITAGDDKKLKVWDITEGLKLVSERYVLGLTFIVDRE